jgi:pimeloyl-ACP methyl ester carboxylesterase
VAQHAATSTDLFVETWGEGTPAVLVHGSLATGALEWEAQRHLAEAGFRLLVPDRRGYGDSPSANGGEDFLVDADDIVALLGDGAHLVAHSYGGLGAILAAARRPEAILSLTLLEPAVTSCGTADPDWRALVDQVRDMWDEDGDDEAWVVRFLEAVGSGPQLLPPGALEEAVALVPTFRNGRPLFDADLPFEALRRATFPKLVVSGGHHPGFEAMCTELADTIGAARTCVEGAGHEIQFTGPPINAALLALWRS